MHTITRTLSLTVFASCILVACSSDDSAWPELPPFSTDASLADMSLSTGMLTPGFQSTTKDYTAEFGFLQSDIRLTAVSSGANAIIRLNGVVVSSGEASGPIPLAEGLNTMSINVLAEDRVASDSYSIEITREAANSFAQQAYIKASNTESDDAFSGSQISLYENTLAVGAFLEDSAGTGINASQSDNGATDAGAVYVFTRDPTGTWSQQAYLKASNTDAGDNFGYSVSVYQDTLAVSAPTEDGAGTGASADQSDNSADGAGAVFVFTRDQADTWSQQAYIKASNTESGDNFGLWVSVYANTLAVSARLEDSAGTGIDADQSDNSAENSGAVYVFTRDQADVWSQQSYIKASNTDPGDEFGREVSLFENTMAVSSQKEASAGIGINADQSDNSAAGSGSVYVFTRDTAGSWSQQAYIKASNTEAGDEFGRSISVYDDTLAVSARLEDSAGIGINADQSDNSAASAGAVYVFTRLGGAWSQQAYIKASNTDAGDGFGRSVSIYENTLAVVALDEDSASTGVNADQSDNSAPAAGAAYLYFRDQAGIWNQQAYIKASNTETLDALRGITVFGDTVVVGETGEDSSSTGVNGVQSDNSATGSGALFVFQ